MFVKSWSIVWTCEELSELCKLCVQLLKNKTKKILFANFCWIIRDYYDYCYEDEYAAHVILHLKEIEFFSQFVVAATHSGKDEHLTEPLEHRLRHETSKKIKQKARMSNLDQKITSKMPINNFI